MDGTERTTVAATHKATGTKCRIPAEDTEEFPHADYTIERVQEAPAKKAGSVTIDDK